MSRRGWVLTGVAAVLVAGGYLAYYRSERDRWPWEKSWAEQEDEEQRRKYAHRILKMVALTSHCYDVRYSPDGKYVGLAMGNVEIRDAKTLQVTGKWKEDGGCTSLSFHPTKPWIACGTWRDKGVIVIRTWPQGELVKEVETDTDGVNFDGDKSGMGDDRILSCAFSADGGFLVATTNMGTGATVHDTETWTKVGEIKRAGERPFKCLPFPRTSRFVCNFNKGMHVYSFTGTPEEQGVSLPRSDPPYEFVCMDDEEKLAVFDTPRRVRVCVAEMASGKVLLECSPTGNLRCVAVSHQGSTLSIGDDYSYVCFWNIASGKKTDAVKFGAPIRHIRYAKEDDEVIVNLGTALVRFQM